MTQGRREAALRAGTGRLLDVHAQRTHVGGADGNASPGAAATAIYRRPRARCVRRVRRGFSRLRRPLRHQSRSGLSPRRSMRLHQPRRHDTRASVRPQRRHADDPHGAAGDLGKLERLSLATRVASRDYAARGGSSSIAFESGPRSVTTQLHAANACSTSVFAMGSSPQIGMFAPC